MRKQYDVRLIQKVEDLVVRKMLKSRNGREASLEYTGKNKVLGFGGDTCTWKDLVVVAKTGSEMQRHTII